MTSAAAVMDFDLELGTDNFTPTKCRLWHIASQGKEIEKRTLNNKQVVDIFCLTTHDLEILQMESIAEFCFRKSNKSLLLASEKLVIIWNSSVCYVSYDDISSKRFQDFVIAAKAWVSNGFPFDNSLVIRAALRLVYEGMQDQVHKLKRGVEDSWYFPRTLRDLGEKGALLSSKSKKVMVEIFEAGSPGKVGGVAVFLKPNQLQDCKKLWNSIPEQLDSIRAMLNKKLQKLRIMMVFNVVFWIVIYAGGLLMVVVPEPISVSSVLLCVFSAVLIFSFVNVQLRGVIYAVRAIWLA